MPVFLSVSVDAYCHVEFGHFGNAAGKSFDLIYGRSVEPSPSCSVGVFFLCFVIHFQF